MLQAPNNPSNPKYKQKKINPGEQAEKQHPADQADLGCGFA
jgi:hypothetical protein